jgi:signal transduction histidine kinase
MEVLEIKQIIGDKSSTAKTNMAIGILAYEMSDYHKSISFLKTAEKFFLESDNIFELKPIYLFMAKSYYKLNLSKEAYSSLLSSYELSDSLYTIESAKIIEELEIKYQTEKKEQEIVSLTKEKALESAQSKNKTYFILILVLVIFIAGITIYFYFKNNKNRHLRKITMERALEAESQKRRFAKELHDGTGSNLTGIRLRLLALKDSSMVDNKVITEIIEEVERTHQGVRLLAYQASPPEFDNYTLDEAISDLVRRLTKTGSININYFSTVTLDWLTVSGDYQLAVYRIIQEALSNIIKHSGANNADIQLIQHEDSINLMIEDDGIGFDVTIVNKGLGLRNMKERASNLNAYLKIDSALKRGTTIILEIPILKNI